MKTAMQLLFKEFEALSKASRDAKDLQTANLIDFLCERKQVALEKEKEQIMDAYWQGAEDIVNIDITLGEQSENYYNEFYTKK